MAAEDTVEIVRDIHWVGARHPELTVFDELFPTKRGTTYNSYLVQGSEKVALIDTVKAPFAEEFLGKLEGILPLEKIDLVVINHTEPDHSGALGALLDKRPGLPIYCTRAGEKFLEQLYDRPLNTHTVSDGEEVDLGGRTLRFILAPFLHWPDTMFTHLPEEKLLFSCDAFGAHFCGEGFYNDEVEDFSDEFAHYFDCIMRPFTDKIRTAVSKVEGLDLSMVCPSHGPILRQDPKAAIASYGKWSTFPENEKPRALMLVLSSHGNTRAMSEEVLKAVDEQGMEVVVKNVYDVPTQEIRAELERADLLLVGSPTINRDVPPPVWNALMLISSVAPKNRLGAAFGSFGWSGEAVKMVEERLKGLKYKIAAPGLCFRFTPTQEDIETCREFGQTVAAAVVSGE